MDLGTTINTDGAAESSTADIMLSSSTFSTFAGDLAPKEASSPSGEEKVEEKGAEPVKEEPKTEEVQAQETKTEEVKEEKVEDRFDKHPRFQELISEKNNLKSKNAQLEKAIEQLASEVNALKTRKEPEVPIDQELDELFEVSPTKAMLKIKELAKQEAKQELLGELSERSTYNNLSSALKTYQDQNPEFTQMWESGELQAFADANPLYNTPIAAYEYLSGQKKVQTFQTELEQKVAAAVEAARKEEKEAAEKRIKEIEANHKAKKETTVVTERASAPSSASKSETETGGDKLNWMISRFKQREASS